MSILETLKTEFDWSNTKPEFVERLQNAIAGQVETIEICTGKLANAKQITWFDYGCELLFDATNFRFDSGGWADDSEQVIAIRN